MTRVSFDLEFNYRTIDQKRISVLYQKRFRRRPIWSCASYRTTEKIVTMPWRNTCVWTIPFLHRSNQRLIVDLASFSYLDGFGKNDFQEESTDVRGNEDRHSAERQTRWRNLGCHHSGSENWNDRPERRFSSSSRKHWWSSEWIRITIPNAEVRSSCWTLPIHSMMPIVFRRQCRSICCVNEYHLYSILFSSHLQSNSARADGWIAAMHAR